jgi:hypothetical protein
MLEVSLHQKNVRSDRESLELLLHPSFKEVGYSGTTYDFNHILETLLSEGIEESTPEIWSQEFEFINLSSSIVQVLYLSAHEENGVLSRHAKRTSIWVKDSPNWKMQYHQATPTASFEKSCA